MGRTEPTAIRRLAYAVGVLGLDLLGLRGGSKALIRVRAGNNWTGNNWTGNNWTSNNRTNKI